MKSIALMCLAGALALPVALAAQETSAPQQPTAAPAGQNQQPPPGGRGGRGATMPAQQAPTPAPPEGRPGGRGMAGSRFDDKAMQNVRVDVTLTDNQGSDSPSKKTVTIVLVDGNAGAIRSTNGVQTLNIDIQPHVRTDGKIFVSFSLQYYPSTEGGPSARVPAVLNESLSVIVADGKPMVVSQSADPRSDRKVAVELTAAVVK
ncbi:MAG TPA: hypothetical protein VLT86_04450 [Vicinamibacterales bacterium]|nr:hypothetical protein [Vicinamibacterales bacterium]